MESSLFVLDLFCSSLLLYTADWCQNVCMTCCSLIEVNTDMTGKRKHVKGFSPKVFLNFSSFLYFLSHFLADLWCFIFLTFTLAHSPTQVSNTAHPEEDVLGGVKACGVDACGVRRRALALDAAGKARDGALDRLCVCVTLAARHRVRDYEVYRTLCRSTDLVIRDGNRSNRFQTNNKYNQQCITAMR